MSPVSERRASPRLAPSLPEDDREIRSLVLGSHASRMPSLLSPRLDQRAAPSPAMSTDAAEGVILSQQREELAHSAYCAYPPRQ